jgi:ribosome recycling factor
VFIPSFACKSMFCGVCHAVLQLQFINTGSLRSVISLLKQVSSEVFESKSYLMQIALVNVSCAFSLWFGRQVQPTWGSITHQLCY